LLLVFLPSAFASGFYAIGFFVSGFFAFAFCFWLFLLFAFCFCFFASALDSWLCAASFH
jgi:hypothetical protein